MFGPTIVGKTCILHQPYPNQAATIAAWFADQEITQYLGLTHPPLVDHEEEWVRDKGKDGNSIIWGIYVECGDSPGGPAYVTVQGTPCQLVGITSVDEISWRHEHGTTGTIIGEKSVWRQGIGKELMQLRRDWVFANTRLHKLCSGYLDENRPSARAQKRAGYKIVGRQRQHFFRNNQWFDHVITEITRSHWEHIMAETPEPS